MGKPGGPRIREVTLTLKGGWHQARGCPAPLRRARQTNHQVADLRRAHPAYIRRALTGRAGGGAEPGQVRININLVSNVQ
jgi:hypothetical protein